MVSPCPDNPGRGVWSAFAAAVACAFAHVAVAGSLQPPDHGFQFATITHPGNASIGLNYFGTTYQVGRVDYAYRMATTEVTNAQWVQFLNVYVPLAFPGQAVTDHEITGALPQFAGFNQQGNAQYAISAARANRPVSEMGWRYAARFVNWLDNGKRTGPDAILADFETGAYDTSTFGTAPYPGAPPGSGSHYFTDQQRRSAGALFWIPSYDEWVKAAYWDPNKNGPGQPGYWQYPITSDTAPIPGNPANGGQTNTGTFPPGQTRPLDVGSYPTAQSPWGVLDLSGGMWEWLEYTGPGPYPTGRYYSGSSAFDAGATSVLDSLRFPRPNGVSGHPLLGLRIASAVPSPGTGVLMAGALAGFTIRRRRSHAQIPHVRRFRLGP